MKDWESKLEEMHARLGVWNEAYERELQRLREERLSTRGFLGRFRRPRPEELEPLAREARAAAGAGFLAELYAFFDELGAFYLGASIQDRAKVRARMGRYELFFDYLWSYIQQAPDLLRSSDDEPRLRLALAAVSIDDFQVEMGQLNEVLGRLYLAARLAGIDPRPVFAAVAAVSNPGTSGGGSHMAEYLRDFEHSFHFRRVVEPELRSAGYRSNAG